MDSSPHLHSQVDILILLYLISSDGDEIKIRGKWTLEEDNILRAAVVQHGGKNWKKISENLSGRSDVQCLHRWQKVLKPGLIKGPWTKEVNSQLFVVLIDDQGG